MTIRGKTSVVSTDGSFVRGGIAGSTTEISGRGYGETPGAGWAPTSREDRAMTLAEAGFPVYLRGTPEDREAFARHLASRLPSRTPAEVADTDRVRARVGLPPAGDTPIVVVPSNVTVQELGGTDQHPGLIAAANGGVLCMDANGLTSSHRAMVDEARDTGVARPPFEADGLPSRFALVTGASVCPCGQEPCVCDAATIKRWKRKTTVSAPVRLDMTRVTDRTEPAPSRSAVVRRRTAIAAAVSARGVRQADMTAGMVKDAGIEPAADREVDRITRQARLTGRQVLDMLRMARTLADTRSGSGTNPVRAVDIRNARQAQSS